MHMYIKPAHSILWICKGDVDFLITLKPQSIRPHPWPLLQHAGSPTPEETLSSKELKCYWIFLGWIHGQRFPTTSSEVSFQIDVAKILRASFFYQPYREFHWFNQEQKVDDMRSNYPDLSFLTGRMLHTGRGMLWSQVLLHLPSALLTEQERHVREADYYPALPDLESDSEIWQQHVGICPLSWFGTVWRKKVFSEDSGLWY